MQINSLLPKFDQLHSIHGDSEYSAIYGAGQIDNPRVALIFMNPTARNVSAHHSWKGLRAPWIGTKKVWKLLFKLGLFNDANLVNQSQALQPAEWTPDFTQELYQAIADHSLYITNISKATLSDARPVSNQVYREYLPSMLEELETVRPQFTFTLGNQVSSTLLQRPISVSNYLLDESEEVVLPGGEELKVYPTFYPVGQGQRNMPLAIERIQAVLSSKSY